jgi:hypothetical protein
MGTKVTEFLKIMDPYNAFPSEEFGVNNKYTDIYRGWKPLPRDRMTGGSGFQPRLSS